MNLSELKPKERAKILRIQGSGGISRRMLDMGCVRGTLVDVLKVAPLGDPLEIRIKGYNLSLRKEEARGIEVEKI